MKSMTKLMVVAMLLVAALVVAPVAAERTIDKNGVSYLKGGDIIYVGEDQLNFTENFTYLGTESSVKLVHFTDKTADNTIILPTAGAELRKSDVGTKTGSYYVLLTSDPSNLDKIPAGRETVEIQIPRVDLDVRLWEANKSADSLKDSVKDKSITRNENLFFRVDTNLNGFVGVANAPVFDIEVTLPGGGVTTQFRGVSALKGVPANESTTIYRPAADGAIGNITKPIDLKGIEAGTYVVQAKWPKATSFYDKGFDSNAVSFEVLTKALAISSNKDSVVRGNSFTVTITGESNKEYYLYIKDAKLDKSKYPEIVPSQKGWQGQMLNGSVKGFVNTSMVGEVFKTTAGGTRSIQFDTNTDTDDRQFTIRVEDPEDPSTYDEVKVRVEEGDVTITASGTGTYYIGEEITLSGTCTEGDTVYLFMTGPNLKTNGVHLIDLIPAKSGDTQADKATFKDVEVEADDTWSYKWNTADINGTLDAGGYTIWAVSKPRNKEDLSEANYATTSVHLNTGYLTATSSGATVAKGDELKITGTAMGDPNNVRIWIFGKNYYGKPSELYVRTETVESDGSFELTLKSGERDELAAGQYFVIIQHPMGNGEFDVRPDPGSGEGFITATGKTPFKITGRQASDAAAALVDALDSVNVDDTYVKITFTVEEPRITIDPIGIKEAGSKFTITGTTNMAVGDKLIVEVTSSAFGPTKKGEAGSFGSVSGVAVVEKGDGVNKWSFEVDAATLKPDEYIVKVECVETDTTTTAIFDLVEAVETTPPAGEVTTPPAEEVTTPPAEETTTEPTPPTPGFGALVALAGLGAVAFLVLRRK